MENVSVFSKKSYNIACSNSIHGMKHNGKIHVFAQIKEKYLGIMDIYSMKN